MKDSLEKPKKSRRKKPKSERNAISLNLIKQYQNKILK